ncbi:mazg nucleotide pyrophosphohydrolase [Nitritalea halalkaliphila LW7]|uniref:Mazg nucleotide pyrophosphohydrolase n=1 Tax=Nitritalea halalkaliphila LW7 TaxID=1189621 RepID=I5C2U9_9BACT|nr:nucleotide pyrophosphohydrolase [Nitritalea halalkaliphila]EIM76151.1 mazg nucleotide pyrophosphohydrolase [Nitritalea halalkaliphila LW7]
MEKEQQTQELPSPTLQEVQAQVDHWIKTVGVRYFNELTNTAILMEEVGELARLMARMYGEQSFKASDEDRDLGDEMADVLWVLVCLANQTGVDLSAALRRNFEKKNIRDQRRHQENDKLKE